MNTNTNFKQGYENLNPKQKQAVDTINGPLCVLANAGSGKSTVVALRCCNILQMTDMKPSNILCLTFSNAGVNSMKKKLMGLMGEVAEQVKVSTFHSFAHDIIVEGQEPGAKNNTSILTPGQRFMILEKLLSNPKTAGTFYDTKPSSTKKLHSLHNIFNMFKKECITNNDINFYTNQCLSSILPYEQDFLLKTGELNKKGRDLAQKITDFSSSIIPLYNEYQSVLEDKRKIEFQDMLNDAVYILETNVALKQTLQERYQYIMIDEFQDCNKIMVALIGLLIKDVESPNLCIVGDELQTIYRFQGANLSNFEWISNMLPEIQTLVLDINYRSTANILNKSYELISQSKHIHPLKKSPMVAGNKQLDQWQNDTPILTSYEDQEQEAYSIACSIKELLSKTKEDEEIIVLARRNNDFIPIQKWLKSLDVEYKFNFSKNNLLETKFGKTIYNTLMCLKFIDKDTEISDAYFCDLLIQCGYKEQLGYAYLSYKKEESKLPFMVWLGLLTTNNRLIEISNISNTIAMLEDFKYQELTDDIEQFFKKQIIEFTKEQINVNINDEWDSFVSQFRTTDNKKSLESLAELLEYYNHYDLSIDYVDNTPNKSRVILSTIHGTKGLEYDYVYLVSLVNIAYEDKGDVYGSINVPKLLNRFIKTEAEDTEDLLKLIYVAMTRAKKNLRLSYFRTSFNGKAVSITSLLKPQLASKSLVEVFMPAFELPAFTGVKAPLNLDAEYFDLVKQKLDQFHISPSSISNWLSCENKFFYHNICKIPGLPSAPTSFGQLLHSTLEFIVESNNLQPRPIEIHNIVDNVFLQYQHRFHPLHRNTYKKYAKHVLVIYLLSRPILKKPLYTEKYLTTTLPSGVRINGFIDRIDATPSDFHIIDYKSNKFAEKLKAFEDEQNIGNGYWKQGAIYHRLIADNFPAIKNTHLSFDYLTLDKRVEFENEPTENFENWLSTIWEEIQSLSLNKTCMNQTCVYCKNHQQYVLNCLSQNTSQAEHILN
jgi:DNA helicase-2/ATP-dependent DNA helicase PcrA